MLPRGEPQPAGFDSDHPHIAIVEERMEQPHRIAAAAHTGHQIIRKAAGLLPDLRAGFPADYRLKVSHHGGVRVWADDRSDDVESRPHVGDPVPQRFINRVLEGAAARVDRQDPRAQQTHAEDVELLALHVLRSHVHIAFQPEHGSCGRRRNAVLAGPSLRDDPLLAHPPRQQHLPHGVIDLVRAGVQ